VMTSSESTFILVVVINILNPIYEGTTQFVSQTNIK
jgi:hypothetical protein